ncbi:MAG TPA: hypothetical protein PLI46_13780 [Methanosarcina thermophila]|nr:hypothetical protein [Methanosarcina thermophila]
MADSTPNSLIKIDTPVTARYGKKQIAVFMVSGFAVVSLFSLISKHPHNNPLVICCLLSIFTIVALVYKCARSKNAIYDTELKTMFRAKNATKKNEMYKYDPKNSDYKKSAWTGLEGVDTEGHFKFRKMKVYENNYCSHGIIWCVTPSDSSDKDSYYKGMESLYKSIPKGCLHKTITAQSKHLANISAVYEEKLKNPNLPLIVRNGFRAKKLFFDEIKNRVGWMHVIFLGIEYTPDDKEANDRCDDVRDRYGKALNIHGIHVRPVTDPAEYAIICAQMGRMDNLEGVL